MNFMEFTYIHSNNWQTLGFNGDYMKIYIYGNRTPLTIGPENRQHGSVGTSEICTLTTSGNLSGKMMINQW